uniref:F-box domain-containing protein n=1 Tax=Ciona savignyi TaxID=51511 RepID=H2Z335_CIOSA
MLHKVGFSDIPDNLMVEIFLYLNVKDLLLLLRVCKRWKRLIPDKWLWKNVQFSPKPIQKTKLRSIVKQYFTKSTAAVDICGKWRNTNTTYAISNNILKTIAVKSPKLSTFKIEDENLNSISLELLPSSIQHLSFTGCEIPLSCLKSCAEKFKNLKSLSFRRCPCLTDAHLACFGSLPKLEKLEIIGSYRIDDDAVQLIGQSFPNLTLLTLIGCARCGDRSCVSIVESLLFLQSLEIEEWTELSERGVNQLVNNCPNIKFLSIKCHQLNSGFLTIHGSRVHL